MIYNEKKTLSELVKYGDSVGIKPTEIMNLYQKVSRKFYENETRKGNVIPLNDQTKESKIIEMCEIEILDKISSKD